MAIVPLTATSMSSLAFQSLSWPNTKYVLHLNKPLKLSVYFPIQVHYGLYIEWDSATGGLHQIPDSAKHAWLALLVVSYLSNITKPFIIRC